jgi:hypothetical protein
MGKPSVRWKHAVWRNALRVAADAELVGNSKEDRKLEEKDQRVRGPKTGQATSKAKK